MSARVSPQPYRKSRSSWRKRAGSATRSISTIFAPVALKPKATRGLPPGAHTAPASPMGLEPLCQSVLFFCYLPPSLSVIVVTSQT
jgi:hypothetical protein